MGVMWMVKIMWVGSLCADVMTGWGYVCACGKGGVGGRGMSDIIYGRVK